MAEINLKHFVDINIQSNVIRAISGTRSTMVLFTGEGTSGTSHVITSATEAATTYGSGTTPTTLAYLNIFFANGGAKVKVIEGKAYSSLTKADITALDNEFIVIACAIPDINVTAGYTAMKALAVALEADTSIYGINEKIIICRTEETTDESVVKNFGVKYSNVLGAEMTIAAYLSQINIYKQDTVHDYSFTKELITAENITDSTYEDLMDNNINVDVTLVNAVRNIGGNLKDGSELTNAFVKIMLHQTLTSRLSALLVQKIRNSSGVSQIYSVIAQELEFYKSAGYLTTDKVWNANDLDITYNGTTYTIITQGSSITNGYVIKILPISSLTDADKAAHKAPPIYVIIADQYGIRQITINGEVL